MCCWGPSSRTCHLRLSLGAQQIPVKYVEICNPLIPLYLLRILGSKGGILRMTPNDSDLVGLLFPLSVGITCKNDEISLPRLSYII